MSKEIREKYLRVTMLDGVQWDVPARVIAENRAKYYADKDPDTTYADEFEFTMTDKYELQDWAANNMDWDDVKDYAKKVDIEPIEVDYQEGWINGKKEIVFKKAGEF